MYNRLPRVIHVIGSLAFVVSLMWLPCLGKPVCNPRSTSEVFLLDSLPSDPGKPDAIFQASVEQLAVPRKYDAQTLELNDPSMLHSLRDLRGTYFADLKQIKILAVYLSENDAGACNRAWMTLVKPRLDGDQTHRIAHYRDIEVKFNEVELVRDERVASSDDGRLIVFPYNVFVRRLGGTTNVYDALYQKQHERIGKLVVLSTYLNLATRHLRLKVFESDHRSKSTLSNADVDRQVKEHFSVICADTVNEVCLLHAAMKVSESPPREAFTFADALFNNSALSFGVSQFDLGVKSDPEGEAAIEALYGSWKQPSITSANYNVARQPIRHLNPTDLSRLYNDALPELSSKLVSKEAEPVVMKGYLNYLARGTRLAQSREQKMTLMKDANQRVISGVIIADLLNQGNFQGKTLNHAVTISTTHCEFIQNLSVFLKPRATRPEAVIQEFNSVSKIKVDSCKGVFTQWRQE